MRYWGLSFAALAACSSSTAPPPPVEAPTPTEPARPPEVAVLFERLVGGWDQATPLFGPDGGITIGPRQWSRDGAYRGRHAWSRGGQRRAIAVIGDAAHPMVLGVDWNEGKADSLLVVAAPDATTPAHAAPIGHDFLADNLTLAPSRTALAGTEGEDLVVRALPNGDVLARAPIGDAGDKPLACWVDDARVAWIVQDAGAPVLRTLSVRTHTVESVKLATGTTLAACDGEGGMGAVTLDAGAIGVLDLTRGVLVASLAITGDDPRELAIGAHGTRLAVASASTFALYERVGATLTPIYARSRHDREPPSMAFSPDGARLAIVGPTLVVLGPKAEVRPRAPAPSFAFTLPKGFVEPALDSEELMGWSYAQLPAPSGFVAWPAMFLRAIDTDGFTDAIGVTLERDELAGVPALDASDTELAAFGRRAMAQLFDNWAEASDEDHDTFTLHVGHTKGLPWVETREIWRDGCEPYDGYTRIVIDTDSVHVVRALTIPGGPINDWLPRLFAIPFGMRTQTALRRGPSMGPC